MNYCTEESIYSLPSISTSRKGRKANMTSGEKINVTLNLSKTRELSLSITI